jgi:hypothetical protein
LANAQITVRARDCQGRPKHRPFFIGDVLAYRGQEWIVVGLFMGVDQSSGGASGKASEVEEYLVLEGRQIEEPAHAQEGREERGKAL